jgi:hypothetical protein
MTRGLGGVLTLPSRGITSGAASAPISYRFISAHCLIASLLSYGIIKDHGGNITVWSK